ncbi:hypothetical protein [Mesorhizobium sp. NFR06]|uniref:hypothetical protein n=1 Tax=Mesorhizobium sp. NFR06 TaxID=1566290 RepID=UPI00165F1195|nr:hypothetical protein [Mesorhizobium sp. NFR06]
MLYLFDLETDSDFMSTRPENHPALGWSRRRSCDLPPGIATRRGSSVVAAMAAAITAAATVTAAVMAAAVPTTFAVALTLMMIALMIIARIVTLVALVRADVDAVIVVIALQIFSRGVIFFMAACDALLLIVLHRRGHLAAVIGARERRLRRQNAEQGDRSHQQQGKGLHVVSFRPANRHCRWQIICLAGLRRP